MDNPRLLKILAWVLILLGGVTLAIGWSLKGVGIVFIIAGVLGVIATALGG